MPANKIKLEICGSNYVIATTDTEEYVLSLAEKLDSDMTQMLASNPTASVTTAAGKSTASVPVPYQAT